MFCINAKQINKKMFNVLKQKEAEFEQKKIDLKKA